MENQQASKKKTLGRWKMFAILAVCASPMIGSYLAYYVVKPDGRTNYGDILDPRQYPMPRLQSTALDGKPAVLEDYRGKWIMLQADGGLCSASCKEKLFEMRQLRLIQGKERERIERVWLITDSASPDATLMSEFDGTHMLRVPVAELAKWLPVDAGNTVTDHMYLIDPMGNLMMRFPKDADPNKVKKDLNKLLRASSIG